MDFPAYTAGMPLAMLGGSTLFASLIGSVHCVGMCGGFVALMAASGVRYVQAAYHLGRGISYVSLGALAGAGGATASGLAERAGVGRYSGMVIATMLVALFGVQLLRTFWPQERLVSLASRRPASWPQKFANRITRSLTAYARPTTPWQALAFGLGTALLPCGWLWSFALLAASTQRALWGAVGMGSFWLGTLPALVATGAILRVFGERGRRLAPAMSLVSIALLACASLVGHWQGVAKQSSGDVSPHCMEITAHAE